MNTQQKIEQLARECVNEWIQQGMYTADMRDRRGTVTGMLSDFITRDIRAFAETGEYLPKL